MVPDLSSRRRPGFAFALAMAVALPCSAAWAQSTYDGAVRRVARGMVILERIEGPFEAVIVGDPALLAASVVNSSTLALTGLAAGRTNVIVLSETGETQAAIEVEISEAPDRRVAVYRGSALEVMTCDGLCRGQAATPPARAPDP